ncbi:hypothetical protein N665_0100s0033 [Sinapis alba]|nr:hypothetical protein N665_0100s0033 [Sinapis alba]
MFGKELFPIKSIAYHTDDSKLVSAVRDALHDDKYEELKESRLGVFLKFNEFDFGWASRLVHYMLYFQLNIKKKYELWSLVGADPVRFSLIEFEQLTGLNCEYIENLENLRCEITKEMTSFWEQIGVSVDVVPSLEQIIRACQRYQEWSQDDRMRLGYLAIFTGFIEGKKYSTAIRASLARLVMDLEKFESYPWGRVLFKVLMDSFRAKDFTKSYTDDRFIQVLQLEVNHELLGKRWYQTVDQSKDTRYIREGREFYEESCVREEDIERPSKKTRIKAPAEPHLEDVPEARLEAIPEASIPVSEVDKAYIEKYFKDLTKIMRDAFGTCLKEMKLLENSMDVVEKKLRITGKGTSSDDLQQTTSSLPKRGFKHGVSSETSLSRHDEGQELSSSKALSVDAKEKEVKEGKEKELKEKATKGLEKATKGLEKALVKAKDAKVKEAKAKKAKANETKEKEAKEKEAKEKKAKEKEKRRKMRKRKKKEENEEKEAKLAVEA